MKAVTANSNFVEKFQAAKLVDFRENKLRLISDTVTITT